MAAVVGTSLLTHGGPVVIGPELLTQLQLDHQMGRWAQQAVPAGG